jgi:hypothetical protein
MIEIEITKDQINRANQYKPFKPNNKSLLAHRNNHFQNTPQFYGNLAEIILYDYYKSININVVIENTRHYDLKFKTLLKGEKRIDVKSKTMNVKPSANFNIHIPASKISDIKNHKKNPKKNDKHLATHFGFVFIRNYTIDESRLAYIMGFISVKNFIDKAKYMSAKQMSNMTGRHYREPMFILPAKHLKLKSK